MDNFKDQWNRFKIGRSFFISTYYCSFLLVGIVLILNNLMHPCNYHNLVQITDHFHVWISLRVAGGLCQCAAAFPGMLNCKLCRALLKTNPVHNLTNCSLPLASKKSADFIPQIWILLLLRLFFGLFFLNRNCFVYGLVST
jgi:hypothetical protein